ncbi:MAG: pentapeptide repeat-containing protein [Actinomycetota bacterium]
MANPSATAAALGEPRHAAPEIGPGCSLIGADLRGRDLSGADLSGADLSNADLTDARLVGADLTDAVLFRATVEGASLLGADATNADLTEVKARAAVLGSCRLDGANLFSADLTEATLSESSLVGADLRSAVLHGARLRGAALDRAELRSADLTGADLTGASVDHADFADVCLSQADVRGVTGYPSANWLGADISDIDFNGAYALRRTIMDENYLHEFRSASRWSNVLYLAWKVTSDCGRSLARWAVVTLAMAVGFALAYTQVDIDYGDYETTLSPLYFSVVTLTTLGYGDVLPASLGAQVVVLLEVITGYIMLGGLLSIFATKMGRRAE